MKLILLTFITCLLSPIVNAGIPLTHWYSSTRQDHMSSDWTGHVGQSRSPDYKMLRVEGYMIELNRYNPESMVKLALWYNDTKGDNALLPQGMNPGAGYRYIKDIGAAYKTTTQIKGALPLYIWHNPNKNDYHTTTSWLWAANKGARPKLGYRFIGKAGNIIPPFNEVRKQRIKIPVKIFFEWDAISRNGQFTFGPGKHTYAEIVAEINLLNGRLAQAAGVDGRRLEFFIEDVKYMQWVKQRGCELAKSMAERSDGEKGNIILYVTDKCASANWGIDFAFINEFSGVHEVGHVMGLYHTHEGNTTYVNNSNWGKAEPLARILDPNDLQSCFRTGDRICDTMADYKMHDTDNNACVETALPCQQTGPVCDITEFVFDRTGDCRSRTNPAPYAIRNYDHNAPNYPIPNEMSYRLGAAGFTFQQFLVMYSSAKWRAGLGSDVPSDEKHIIREPSNLKPGFWNKTPTRIEFLRYQ